MEALAAFGLACNVIQVVDFGLKTISKSRELAKNGSLEVHDEMRKDVNRLSGLIQDLDQALTSSGPNPGSNTSPQTLNLIKQGQECRIIGQQIEVVLKELEVDKSKKLDYVKKTYKALRTASKLKELQVKLSKQQELLQTRILVDIEKQVRDSTSETSLQFRAFNDKIDLLIRNMETVRLDHSGAHKMDLVQKVQSEIKDLRDAFNHQATQSRQQQEQDSRMLISTMQGMRQGLEQRIDKIPDLLGEGVVEKLKRSLVFPEMTARQRQIADAHAGTFEWLFDKNTTLERQQEPHFLEWLEQGSGIFWMSGKPGSGKSYLMNFIMQSAARVRALEKWMEESKLIETSFFFWLVGSPMQHSLRGLLQAMLYQMLSQNSSIASALIQTCGQEFNDVLSSGRDLAWSQRQLLEAIYKAVDTLPDLKYFFLIDGLDEVAKSDHWDLFDMISCLSEKKNVKLCISSRPLPIFKQRFLSVPHLKLEDLTRRDIEKFTHDWFSKDVLMQELKLASHEEVKQLERSIANKASGVFLWVSLVVKELLAALSKGDSLLELKARLEIMPEELEELFAKMLSYIDKVHRAEANRMFNTMAAMVKLQNELGYGMTHVSTCFALCLWIHDNPEKSNTFDISPLKAAEITLQCGRRLAARTSGLIEFLQGDVPPYGVELSTPAKLLEARFTDDEKDSETIYNWNSSVDFIHRTVYDYLIESSGLPEWLKIDAQVIHAIRLSFMKSSMLWTGWVRVLFTQHLLDAYELKWICSSNFNQCMATVIDLLNRGANQDMTDVVLGDFARHLEYFGKLADKMYSDQRPQHYTWLYTFDRKTTVCDFGGLVSSHNLRYAVNALQDLSTSERGARMSYYLSCAIHPYGNFDLQSSVVKYCLEQGADPNAEFDVYGCDEMTISRLPNISRIRTSAFARIIMVLDYFPLLPENTALLEVICDMISLLIHHGADMTTSIDYEIELESLPYREEPGKAARRAIAYMRIRYTPLWLAGRIREIFPATSYVSRENEDSFSIGHVYIVLRDEFGMPKAILLGLSTEQLRALEFQLKNAIEAIRHEDHFFLFPGAKLLASHLCENFPEHFFLEDFEYYSKDDPNFKNSTSP